MENEIWKDIPGYEGFYQASNYGKIRSIDRVVDAKNRKLKRRGVLMKLNISNNGYYMTTFRKGSGVVKTELVHRMVATSFISNPLNLPCINHIDNNPLNNIITNLEWVDRRGNFEHYSLNFRTGNTSQYFGVFYEKVRKKFRAQISINGKVKFIGRYENEIDARNAYEMERKRLYV